MQRARVRSDEELIEGADALNARVCRGQLEFFRLIAEIDRREAWLDWGARDMAHWLWMRYGISDWKARRWIQAAHALESLPLISEAFSRGELGIDKVVELTRFVTRETEGRLLEWAKGVSCARIRYEGDLAVRRSAEDAADIERGRRCSWWYFDEGRRFGLSAELPSERGAVVAKALERIAEDLPVMPGEEDPYFAEARCADALVALCSANIAEDQDAERATVVVHARVSARPEPGPEDQGGFEIEGGCEIERGGVIGPEAAGRLLCDARVQAVVEDEKGDLLRIGRISREPPSWMLRQLRYRDSECRFPGCGARRFTQAHHIVWWERGGRTDLENLLLVCTFHHRLVHEHGWSVRRDGDGTVRWFGPDGSGYREGPGPPRGRIDRQAALSTAEPQPALSAASV